MSNFISANFVSLLTLLLIVVGVLGSLFYIKVLQPRYLASEFYKRYGLVVGSLGQVVTDIVLRLAFSKEDLSQYEDEAKKTGRDIRLVAAIHLVNNYTNAHGIQLDEELIISTIEATLVKAKAAGLIPANNPAFPLKE